MKKLITLLAVLSIALAGQTVSAKSARTKSSDKPTTSTHKKKSSQQAGVLNNTTCPVSGQKIGAMGPGTQVSYKGYTVNLCCNGCREKFSQNPDAYLNTALNGAGK